MTQKLTYEEWRTKYATNISAESMEGLEKFHNIDAAKEIESAMRKEYEFYVNGGFDC